MCSAEVTAISLVTKTSNNKVSPTLIPYVARALSNQRATYERLPITRDSIDWVVNETDQLTVALDEAEGASIILVAGRGKDSVACATRLANIAAELCRDYEAHTVFWNGSSTPISAEDFLAGDQSDARAALAEGRITPRKIRAQRTSSRAARRRSATQIEYWLERAMRTHVLTIDPDEIEQLELDERRAKTNAQRLSAWALSLTAAIFAAPLALPVLVHNLVRGEDIKAGALSLGVAGLYATLAHSGMAPMLASVI